MKKTIIALLALCGCASAATELVAEWDNFSSLTNNGYTLTITGTATKVEDGILKVTGSNPVSATIDVSDAGLTFGNGFTLNMTLSNVNPLSGDAPYGFVGLKSGDYVNLALAGVNSSSYDAKFCYRSSSNNITTSYPEETSGDLSILTSTTTVSTLTITFSNSVFNMYLNGGLVATGTPNSDMMNDNISSVIDTISFGAWAGGSDNGLLKEYVHSFAIYEGAMTAAEVRALMVPEPTTATLSLLALAGLAARRRRR